jgi:hypothetical protein
VDLMHLDSACGLNRSSVSSLITQHAGKLCPVPGTRPGEDVGHVTFNRLARQEKAAGDLRVAVAGADQGCDLPLSLAESVQRTFTGSRLTPPPGPDAEASQPELCHLLLRSGARGASFVSSTSKLVGCALAVAFNQCRCEVESVPERCAHQTKSLSLREERFQLGYGARAITGQRD